MKKQLPILSLNDYFPVLKILKEKQTIIDIKFQRSVISLNLDFFRWTLIKFSK